VQQIALADPIFADDNYVSLKRNVKAGEISKILDLYARQVHCTLRTALTTYSKPPQMTKENAAKSFSGRKKITR
jgi:hypothetical protein